MEGGLSGVGLLRICNTALKYLLEVKWKKV